MRTFGFNATTKVAVVSGPQTFSQSDIGASTGIIGLGVRIGGTGAGRFVGAGGLERVVVKADNEPIFDLFYPQIKAMAQRFYPKGYYYQLAATAQIAASGVFLPGSWGCYIPLNFMDRDSEAEADQCQFPPGASIAVELYGGATITAAATYQIGWLVTNQPAQASSKFLNTFLNFTANAAQYAPMAQGGIMRGVTLPVVGVTRWRLTVGGIMVLDTSGMVQGAAAPPAIDNGTLIRIMQQPQDIGELAGENQNTTVHPDHCAVALDIGLPIQSGNSKFEADCQATANAAWLTATPENTAGIWSYFPLLAR